MKRILITGGEGFVGNALARRLKVEGHWVKTLGRARGNPDYKMNITSIGEEVINFDVIIHAASTVNEYNFLAGSDRDITTNCLGTQALLEACRKYNPWARIVFISSFFACGNQDKLPVDEEVKCNPVGVYGSSKLFCENLCMTYHKTFDLDIVIARGTNIYGSSPIVANQKVAATNWIIESCVTGRDIPLYDRGFHKRDFLFIDDACSGIMNIMRNGKSGELYWLSSGTLNKFYDIIEIAIMAGYKPRIIYVDSPGFHKRVGIGAFCASNEKLKSLGWQPTMTFSEGIWETLDWYRSQQ